MARSMFFQRAFRGHSDATLCSSAPQLDLVRQLFDAVLDALHSADGLLVLLMRLVARVAYVAQQVGPADAVCSADHRRLGERAKSLSDVLGGKVSAVSFTGTRLITGTASAMLRERLIERTGVPK